MFSAYSRPEQCKGLQLFFLVWINCKLNLIKAQRFFVCSLKLTRLHVYWRQLLPCIVVILLPLHCVGWMRVLGECETVALQLLCPTILREVSKSPDFPFIFGCVPLTRAHFSSNLSFIQKLLFRALQKPEISSDGRLMQTFVPKITGSTNRPCNCKHRLLKLHI